MIVHIVNLAADSVVTSQDAMLAAMNAERAKASLSPYGVDGRIVPVAQGRVDDMIARGYFGHRDPMTGADLYVTGLSRKDIGYIWAGENLALIGSGEAAAHAVELFMNSPTHRANVLDSDFKNVGVGYGVRPDGEQVFCIIFIE